MFYVFINWNIHWLQFKELDERAIVAQYQGYCGCVGGGENRIIYNIVFPNSSSSLLDSSLRYINHSTHNHCSVLLPRVA